jgi:hypothetical protein
MGPRQEHVAAAFSFQLKQAGVQFSGFPISGLEGYFLYFSFSLSIFLCRRLFEE